MRVLIYQLPVIRCLLNLFPIFVHFDGGSSFMSEEMENFLQNNSIVSTRITVYNPQSNGQVEMLNRDL